ncbi:MAG: hypothetical protein KF708_10305 [Pirellulales bacterium]|nr:hypothetical protein [Pirellulales bacterium]
MDQQLVSRRSALGTAGLVSAGLVGLSLSRSASAGEGERGSEDICNCVCTLSIDGLKRSELSRAADENRDLIGALIGAAVPILVDEIVKAVRSRDPVVAGGTRVSVDKLAGSEGSRGTSPCSVRGLFSGSFSGPGAKIGIILG